MGAQAGWPGSCALCCLGTVGFPLGSSRFCTGTCQGHHTAAPGRWGKGSCPGWEHPLQHHQPLAPNKNHLKASIPTGHGAEGEHAAWESFPAPALWQGGLEEAQQQALCYTKFPTETMLVPARCVPFGTLKSAPPPPPPNNCKQGQKPPWILSSCRFDENKQLSAHKGQCQ